MVGRNRGRAGAEAMEGIWPDFPEETSAAETVNGEERKEAQRNPA